jgi:AcrR family transcriptional regulator
VTTVERESGTEASDRGAAPDAGAPPRLGLRERKKAKTRQAIQEHAFRLFREQGYDQTTIEQIADAVEISPSTFFRYFPTKEDVVLYDALDPYMFEALARQPSEYGPIKALRLAFREALSEVSPDEMARQLERSQLTLEVPALRMRALDIATSSMGAFASAVAARVGRPVDDLAVQTLVGAVAGIGIMAFLGPGMQGASTLADADILARLDASLELLENGLPF